MELSAEEEAYFKGYEDGKAQANMDARQHLSAIKRLSTVADIYKYVDQKVGEIK